MEAAIKLKGIIFDLDGTLGNTLPICFTAFRCAFEKFLGRRYTDQEITALFGPTEEGIIEGLVPSQSQACLRAYLDEYERAHTLFCATIPGIETALRLLKQSGTALAVVTGKGEHSAAISLQYLSLAHYFDNVFTGSSTGAIKPLAIQNVLSQWGISPHHVAYVGDSPYDIKAAKEVGVIPLGAAWAETTSYESLDEMAPVATFRTVESFIDWIRYHVEGCGEEKGSGIGKV